jgi:protein TonB
MFSPYKLLLRRIDQAFEPLDACDLIPHPLKRRSRRALALALWLSILLHTAFIGGFMLHRLFDAPVQPVPLTAYPTDLLDLIDPSTLVTSEQGGGGGEPPPDPGDQMPSRIIPVAVAIGMPEPVPDAEIAEEQEIAPQEEVPQDMALVKEAAASPAGQAGMAGAGSGDQGIGVGPGSGGGGGGDGPPGTWRYDTPPNPRRLIVATQPKKLRDFKGIIKFRLLISEFGQVIDATVVESSGHKELDELALDAIYKSTFNPATFRGRSVKAWITFGYGFRSEKR